MFARSAAAFVISLAGCFDLPQPPCGFVCGQNDECPAGYACSDGRCLRTSRPADDCSLPDIPDLIAPRVSRVTPDDGATGVSIHSMIVVEFSERVVNVANGLDVLDPDGRPIIGSYMVLEPNRVWAFVPERLLLDRTYTVALDERIYDFADLPLVPRTTSFTTERDDVPPMVAMSTPADGATGVEVTPAIALTFSEPVAGVSQASVRLLAAGVIQPVTLAVPAIDRLEIRYPAQLQAHTEHAIMLDDQIVDFSGNPLAPVELTFTTGADTIGPTVVTTSFFEDDDTRFDVTFDEPVVGVDATSFTLSDGTELLPGTVVYEPVARRARLTLDAPLVTLPGVTYTLALGPEVRDTSGNAVIGTTSWTFTAPP